MGTVAILINGPQLFYQSFIPLPQGGCRTIISANLVDLPFPMICAKIQPQGILGSGE